VTIVLPTEVVGGDSKKLAPDRDVLKKEAGLKNSLKQIELGAKKCPRSRDIKSQNRTSSFLLSHASIP
jgi:hypothetical protein